MHRPILSLEMDEYEVPENQPTCCRSLCCWKFRKFSGDSPREANKRDSDIFYRRFSDHPQAGALETAEPNDDDLMYDEEVFYTEGTLMMPDLTLNTGEKTRHIANPEPGIDDGNGDEIDLGDATGNVVSYRINRVDEAVQTETIEETKGTFCERCQRLHDVIMTDDQQTWYDDANQNICLLESVTSSATWWTITGSPTGTPRNNQDDLHHKLRSSKSEGDARVCQDTRHNAAVEEIDNHVTKIARMKSDEGGYGYKFCWDNLSDNAGSSDPKDSPDSSCNMHDFEEGSLEMESPFLDSNESLLSDDIMACCEFGSGSSSYQDYLANKNNCRADIKFHNKDQNWRLERERCRRQDNLLELLAKDGFSEEDI